MAITHTIGLTWGRSGESIAYAVSVSTDTEHNADVPLTASQTSKEVQLTLDVSELQSIYISADVDIVVKTNSTGSPADTLTIAAETPLVWFYGCGMTCPLGTDVTTVYITNSDATAGTAKLRFLEDATP